MILPVEELILLALFVIIVGVAANIAGFGGGIIIVPSLSIIFDLPLKIVIGTTLLSLALPAIIGFLGAWRRNEVDFTIGIALEIPTMIGSIVGPQFATSLPTYVLQFIFGGIAVILSLLMINHIRHAKDPVLEQEEITLFKKLTNWLFTLRPLITIEKKGYSYKIPIPVVIVAGFCIGFISGLLGVGGGWLKNPLLILGFGLPPIIGSGTALFMLSLTSLTGGLTHLLAGNFDLHLFIVLTLSLSGGALIGDRLKPKMDGDKISIIIVLSLLVVGVIMTLKAFGSIL